MGRKRIEVKAGDRYERLVILGEAPKKNKGRHFYCICDCGNTTMSELKCLRNGESKSCGCLRREIFIKNNTKHGHTKRHHKNYLYNVWQNMKQRCLNNKCHCYERYGGRGITVCEEWLEYIPFYEWAMSNGYRKGLTIERIDNDGNYEPDNCTWIPQSEQSKNTRRSIYVMVNGLNFKTLKDAARYFNISYDTAWGRLGRGMGIEQALCTPIDTTKSHRKRLIDA